MQSCERVDRIVVGSDCSNILAIAKEAGAETVVRPDYYCDEKVASANEMISNMCSLIETDIVLWSHCTNPLLSPKTYDEFISLFFEKEKQNYDSVLSVDEVKEHLWDEKRLHLTTILMLKNIHLQKHYHHCINKTVAFLYNDM